MRRKMLFTIFKYLISFLSIQVINIRQLAISCILIDITSTSFLRNV